MSRLSTRQIPNRAWKIVAAITVLLALLTNSGCSGTLGASHQASRDPLGLGIEPGPAGSTIPQTIEVRIGSEPNDRIVSLSLTLSSLQLTNSGAENLELLTAPVTVELARSGIASEPILVREIYQDTYSALTLPAMTGNVVFYDSNGQLVSQVLNITGQNVNLSPTLVLGDAPLVFSVDLDLAQSFTVNSNSVSVNSLVVTAQSAMPSPPSPPAPGQPETGSVNFLVGEVTAVDTSTHVVTLQPSSGDVMALSYDPGTTVFDNCSPAMLTGMMVEARGVTQVSGTILAGRISLIGNHQSSSEVYGVLTGLAPDMINYNLVVNGGLGVNFSNGLLGKTITVDWLNAGYAINGARVDLSASPDLVFDETRPFPGQHIELKWDSLLVPDPDGVNAGYFSPAMIVLEEQTLSGLVSGYAPLTGFFNLSVGSNSALQTMNPGLISIAVRQTPQTNLLNSPTFDDGDHVSVRGLLFLHPDYSYAMEHPGDPLSLIMVADRISK